MSKRERFPSSHQQYVLPLPSVLAGRGRAGASTLPITPGIQISPGVQKRIEVSQPSETHSIAAGNKKAETMAPPITKEKLTNVRNLAKAKLLSVL